MNTRFSCRAARCRISNFFKGDIAHCDCVSNAWRPRLWHFEVGKSDTMLFIAISQDTFHRNSFHYVLLVIINIYAKIKYKIAHLAITYVHVIAFCCSVKYFIVLLYRLICYINKTWIKGNNEKAQIFPIVIISRRSWIYRRYAMDDRKEGKKKNGFRVTAISERWCIEYVDTLPRRNCVSVGTL